MKSAKEVKAFGKRFKMIRQEAGFSQQALADECDLGLRTIQRIEAGENAVTIDVLFIIAKTLKISPARFFQD